MKKLLVSAMTLGLLAGCSASQYVVAPEASTREGMNIVQHQDGNYLESVSFRRFYTDVNEVALRQCLAASLHATQPAEEASVSEQKAVPNIRTSKKLDENYVTGNVDTAQGNLQYRLELQLISDVNYYYFDRLGIVQTENGQAGKRGEQERLVPIAAWEGTHPMAVYDALEKVTDTLQGCLARSVRTPGNG